MFGGKEKGNSGSANASSSAGGLNSLVQDTHIEGTIRTASDIRIEGTLIGNLDCQAKLIIGPSGSVRGEVLCRTAMIEGSFEGKIHVTELLEVRETAKVNGEIAYGKLKIDAGATMTGQLSLADAKKPAVASTAQRNGKAAVVA